MNLCDDETEKTYLETIKFMKKSNTAVDEQKVPFIFSILGSLLVSLFPSFYLYSKNFKYLGYKDILLAVGVVALHWLIILCINLILIKKINKAVLVTIIAILSLSLFHLGIKAFSRIFSGFYYWHGAILVVIVYSFLWILIKNKLEEKNAQKINLIIGAVFIILIIINSSGPLLTAYKNRGDQTEKAFNATPALEFEAQATKTEGSPNIYMFIFDEYSGDEGLERYTGFNNRDFNEHLINLGFNVSSSSRNYTTSTSVEIPNLLNLSIRTKEASVTKKDELLSNPFLFSILKQSGYDLNLINDQGFISTPDSFFKYQFSPQGTLDREESLTILLLDMSVYYPFRNESSQTRLIEVEEMINYAIDSSQLQDSNLFTIGYFLFPHLPWVVDENGKEVRGEDRNNWEKPEVYLGQLKYTNKLILTMVKEIIKNDPHSCIILMSDHGYRQPYHLKVYYDHVIENYALESFYMRNILNAVYVFGDEIDIEGYSGINTLRTVLNVILSMDFDLIEEAK